LELLIERSMNKAMTPVMQQITELDLSRQRHEQLLTGINGQNGLNGDMQTMKRDLKRYGDKLIWFSGVTAGISIAFSLLKNKIFGG
jgi:hypothetical protein